MEITDIEQQMMLLKRAKTVQVKMFAEVSEHWTSQSYEWVNLHIRTLKRKDAFFLLFFSLQILALAWKKQLNPKWCSMTVQLKSLTSRHNAVNTQNFAVVHVMLQHSVPIGLFFYYTIALTEKFKPRLSLLIYNIQLRMTL